MNEWLERRVYVKLYVVIRETSKHKHEEYESCSVRNV